MADNRSVLSSYEKQFTYYRSLGDKSFSQIDDEALFSRSSTEDNSIAIIVKHLWGNMLSRWTDFLSSDGEKEWRKRDEEFISEFKNRDQVLMLWNEGWECLFGALSQLDDSMLSKDILIRNQKHSVLEAINRQLAHYAYHVGQIVLLAKANRGTSWESLSIPRNKSASFNKEKFSKGLSNSHYTDEWIDEN
ncbi:MAG: DUF1572 family protein [Flavobacteriales bacterium]|nr:DUF1572 family protein [Flavobacteriales bacterium]